MEVVVVVLLVGKPVDSNQNVNFHLVLDDTGAKGICWLLLVYPYQKRQLITHPMGFSRDETLENSHSNGLHL